MEMGPGTSKRAKMKEESKDSYIARENYVKKGKV